MPSNSSPVGNHTSFHNDPDICALLSRLAALQGHAVPVHRFGMVEHSADGVEISALPSTDKLVELWRARFDGAVVNFLQVKDLQPEAFPLIWVSADGLAVRLVRGRLSNGDCLAEDASAQTHEIPLETLASGTLIALLASPVKLAESTGPQTATDWFIFAIRRHRRIFIDAIFATFIISTMGLLISLYTMQVYDRVIPTRGFSTLWVLTIGVLVGIALDFIMKEVRSYMVDRASKAIDLELSGVFFGKAMDIRMDARPNTVGTFASQIRHFESVRTFMTSTTLFVLADAPFALMFIGVMALIAGPVALVPLVMLPVSIFAGLYFRRPIEKLTMENMALSNRKNGFLIEAVDGIESIKAAGGEWKMRDRYNKMTASIAITELRMKEVTARSTSTAQVIQQLNFIGLVAAGAYGISTGQLTMGALTACTIISGRALAPLAQIPQLILQWTNAKSALSSLNAIMAMPNDRQQEQRLVVPDGCSGQLELKDLVFGYDNDRPILEVPSLTIRPGERVAVLGSIGSGKSSLIKLLSGLYKPKSGSVFLDHVDMDHLAPEFVREQIGYLPQDVRLFHGSLRENLTLGLPTPNDSVVLRMARLTGLDKIIQNHPKGLELEIHEGGRGLSGGQRQLVGLTRLLLAQPKIMLLDEPTASMDSRLEASVMKHLFEEINPDSILLVVTHKPGLLTHVDRVIVLDKGRIVADGPRDKILALMRNPPSLSDRSSAPTPAITATV
jgi:ATP-binding cassette, subfamily C, bacterial LapB